MPHVATRSLAASGMNSRVAMRRYAMGCGQPMARDFVAKASTPPDEAWDSFARTTGSRYWHVNSSSCGPVN